MPTENILQRLERLIEEAARAGRYNSPADLLNKYKISSGYIAEFRKRIAKNPKAGMTGGMAAKFSGALGVSVEEILTGKTGSQSALVDKYPERAEAIDAARKLKLPEAAIQLVLKEDPGTSPSTMYWFRRIESEAERVAPAADSGSHKI